MPISQPTRARSRALRSLLLAAGAMVATMAWAQPPVTVTSGPGAQSAPQRLNPTGRPISLTVAFNVGAHYVGDIAVTIGADDKVSFSSQRLLFLLGGLVDAGTLKSLQAALSARSSLSPADLAGTGIAIIYNAQTLELVADLPPSMMAAQGITIATLDRSQVGSFEVPAGFSAHLNARGSVDYVNRGVQTGFSTPLIILDGAARISAFAFESEGIWQPGSAVAPFQRQGTRAVYDDVENVMRWTAGDLVPLGQGFQSTPNIAGISLFRSYGVMAPQRVATPRGDQTFELKRASTVEIFINGQSVRRLRLEAGNYNLRDFPFTQGANDIAVNIEDDTGRRQALRFNIFFDRAQLAPGLSEFGLYAGVKSPLTASGPSYSDDPQVSGFYRRGILDNLTLGGNFQADKYAQMTGIEGIWGSELGTIGFNLAGSHIAGAGTGFAATVSLERLFPYSDGQSDAFRLALETRSRNFGGLDSAGPRNLFAYEAGADYAHSFSEKFDLGVSAHFSKGRDHNADVGSYGASIGYRLTPDMNFTTTATYRHGPGQADLGVLFGLTWRLDAGSSARSEYDTSARTARLSYQALRGDGIGAYNIQAQAERSPGGTDLNASANYTANRAELGLSHITSFNGGNFSSISDQRTTLRVGTAIATADGVVAIGRPVYDGFAIVAPHESLKDTQIDVNPTPYGYSSSSDGLGPALETGLSAYSERTLTIDARGAPPGYDLGDGAFRLFPPHHGGYLLRVGSDYALTATGRLLSADGTPVALLAGTATEIANPRRAPVTLFTNAQGKFGATGLRAGKWRIEMPTSPASVYVLDIPAGAGNIVAAGDLKPVEANP